MTAYNNNIPQNAENGNQNMQEDFGGETFSEEAQAALYEKAVRVRGEETRTARKVMDVLSLRYGARFLLYEGDVRTDGAFDPKSGTIYININTQKSLVDAVSHEFMHNFKHIDSAGYQLLARYIESGWNLRKFNQYKNELLSAYDALGIDYSNLSQEELYNLVREEAICDLFSEVMRDPETIVRIAKSNRSVAEKIVEFLERIINEIRAAISSLGTVADPDVRALVKNFESVKALYQEVISQSEGRNSEVTAEGVLTDFSKNGIITNKKFSVGVKRDGDSGKYDGVGETQLRENEEEGLYRRGDQEDINGNQSNSSRRYGRTNSVDERKYDIGEGAEESRVKNVFHATPYRFLKFDKSYVDLGIHFGTEEQARARLPQGIGDVGNYDLILKNPLITEDIFGERTPKQYLDELINNSSLAQDEKSVLKREFDSYNSNDFSIEAKKA